MSSSFSLAYYDKIFGNRTPAFYELLQALAEELQDYAASFGPVVDSGNPESLTQLRHSHQPLVENLKLTSLQTLEEEARVALDAATKGLDLADLQNRFDREARRIADLLILELLPSDPGPL